MKTVKSPAPFARGEQVVVREPGLTPWQGTVRSVKWSPRSGWWIDVSDDVNGVWVIKASDVGRIA